MCAYDLDGGPVEADGRKNWKLFAQNYHLSRGTPSKLWLDHSFQEVFGIDMRLNAETADWYYDHIANCLSQPEYRPRALFKRFNIEAIATTEAATDDLRWHRLIRESGWDGRVVTAYRPDNVIDPEMAGFVDNIMLMGEQTGFDTASWSGYLDAHRARRAYFKQYGATSSDHGHPSARTEDLPQDEAALLFEKALRGACSPAEADAFR